MLSKYLIESGSTRAKMQSKLFYIFTETTGHRPEDICLVEEQVKVGTLEYKTIYYFDLKSRHNSAEPQQRKKILDES